MHTGEPTSWNVHRGGPCPVPSLTKVQVRYRNCEVSEVVEAGKRRWEAWPDIGESEWDIVAWRLAGPPA
jgi:hypothetical protein